MGIWARQLGGQIIWDKHLRFEYSVPLDPPISNTLSGHVSGYVFWFGALKI